MAGTTSSIISNLLSSLERLSQFMPIFASSSSPIAPEDVTISKVNSNQEYLFLNELRRMLQIIHPVLHDAEGREIYDDVIQLRLSEYKEVAYDVENVLDDYDYEVIKTQLEGMTTTTKAKPSLMRKQVDDDDDDDDIPHYQGDWTVDKAMAEDWDSDDSSSDEDSDDSSSNEDWQDDFAVMARRERIEYQHFFREERNFKKKSIRHWSSDS